MFTTVNQMAAANIAVCEEENRKVTKFLTVKIFQVWPRAVQID
jgi:hypothetical protein